jgi:hypothetical protein
MALQPPTDRPVKRSTKRGKQPPLDNPVRRTSKPRVFKGSDGKVNSENIRGVSVGRGVVSDQRAPTIGSRSLGGACKVRGWFNDRASARRRFPRTAQ